MKIQTLLTTALLSMSVLSGQVFAAENKQIINDLDSKKEVHYVCSNGSLSQKVQAMYGIKNGEVVVAQLKINNIVSDGLWRTPNAVMNVFEGNDKNHTIWTTLPATAQDIQNKDGGTLSVRHNGQNVIMLEKCKLDK